MPLVRAKIGAGPPAVHWLWDIRYVDSPVLRWRDADLDSETGYLGLEETLYVCNDANMNVTALIDRATGEAVERYVYDPYGKATFYDGDWQPTDVEGRQDGAASAYASEILYCGYRFDAETGLDQVRFRYYHPTLGRWTSRDNAGYADGLSVYEYCSSSPAFAVDPEGLQAWAPASPPMPAPPAVPVPPVPTVSKPAHALASPCCARLAMKRVATHATVEVLPSMPAKKGERREYLYAHPKDDKAGGISGSLRGYAHVSSQANIDFGELRVTDCESRAWIAGVTAPNSILQGRPFQLSGWVRYKVTITNVDCRTGRLHVDCAWEGAGSGAWGICPVEDQDFMLAPGESMDLPGTAEVGLAWTEKAPTSGAAQVLLRVTCVEG